MKIGDRCFVHGYVDEIRKDTVIIKNKGGYFGTDPGEVITVYDTTHPNWIPCSERLPMARQSVILSTKEWTGEGCYWETTKHHVIWKGYRWNATYWDDEVLAWMPLPEPYKEGGKNEQTKK